MMIVEFSPAHALAMRVQAQQAGIVLPGYAEVLASVGSAYSVVDGDEVIFCGGIAPIWPGRSTLWALLSDSANRHMLFLTRGTRRFLQLQSGRIEAIIKHDFKEAHRWAEMCGLKFHHHEEKYLPDGSDADIYVRFQ